MWVQLTEDQVLPYNRSKRVRFKETMSYSNYVVFFVFRILKTSQNLIFFMRGNLNIYIERGFGHKQESPNYHNIYVIQILETNSYLPLLESEYEKNEHNVRNLH